MQRYYYKKQDKRQVLVLQVYMKGRENIKSTFSKSDSLIRKSHIMHCRVSRYRWLGTLKEVVMVIVPYVVE